MTVKQLAAIDEKIIEIRAKRNHLDETANTRALDETEKRSLASIKEDLREYELRRDRMSANMKRDAEAAEATRNHPASDMETRNSETEMLEIGGGSITDLIEGRTNELFLETLEQRAMSTTGSNAGAETMATKVESQFYRVLEQYSGLWRVARKRPTGLDESPVELPILTASGDGEQEHSEGSEITADDAATGSVTFGAYRYAGLVNLSNSLRNSAGVNMDELVTESLAKTLVREYRARLAVGTGTGMPQGITVGAGAGVTADSETAVTGDELFDLVHSVAAEVRDVRTSSWVMHDSTWLAIRKLKDSNDGTYLVGDLANGAALTLCGYNVQIDNAMPEMASGTVPIVFGAIGDAFQIRHTNSRIDISDAARFKEDEMSYRAIIALDSKVVDSTAIKALTMDDGE